MKLSTCLGIAGLFLAVGLAGCGGSDEAACNPSGRWTVTTSPAAGDDCGEPGGTGTATVTVSNGTATIIDPDGSTNQAPLDGSCHMAYTTQVSSADLVASGSTEWTFTKTYLSGSANAAVVFTDGRTCTLRQAMFGAPQ